MSPLAFPSQVCVSFRHVHGASLSCEPHTCLPYLRCCPSSWHTRPFLSQETSVIPTVGSNLAKHILCWDEPGPSASPAWCLSRRFTVYITGCLSQPLRWLLGQGPAWLSCVLLWLTDARSCPPLLTSSHISPNLNRLSVHWSLRDIQETSVGFQPTGLHAMHTLGLQVTHAEA